MGAYFAYRASLSWLACVSIQSGLGVYLCLLQALAVVSVAAKCAKYHFVSTAECVMAGGTLLDRFLLTILDWSRAKEDRILVVVCVTAPTHDKFTAFRLEQLEEL